MRALFVYFEGKLVGRLHRDQDLIYSFVYEDSWRSDPEAFPLSLKMPLEEKQFANKVTLSFFENLMPEGEVRKRLEESHDFKGAFDFLKAFGRDCAGAVIVTDDENYTHHLDPSARTEVDMQQIYDAIEERESVAEVVSEMNPGYLSLAGAQDKFAAIYEGGKFFLPTQGGPTSHIVKAPIRRKGVKDSVYNEYYCMQLARAVGLRVPNVHLIGFDQPLFIIERYDREQVNGQVRRLHQQDFCQAQGLTSEFKYEANGGPTIKQNYELIRTYVSVKQRFNDLERFLEWICFNLVIGNNDSHSKNISLLMPTAKRIELAPFYDLVCTALYSSLKKEFSFTIGGRTDFTKIGKKQIEQIEDQLEIKRGKLFEQMSAVTRNLMEKKDDVVTAVLNEAPNAKIVGRISELIADRVKGLKNQRAI